MKRSMLWLVVAALAVFGQGLLPVPSRSLVFNGLLEAGHVPLFALFGWAAHRAVGSTRRVVLLTATAAILTEFSQMFVGRDAEVSDMARNLAGGGAALLIASALAARRSTGPRLLLLGAAVALLALGFREVATLVVHSRARARAFPVLYDFQASWSRSYLLSRGTHVQPDEDRALRVTYQPQNYPSLILREPGPDWSHYDAIQLELRAPQPTTLFVRVDDASHDHTPADRFTRRLDLGPGPQVISIPLAEVQQTRGGRRLDLTKIQGFALFLDHPREPLSLDMVAIRLVRTR